MQTRWLIRRDLPEVCRIDFECYQDFWREEDFMECMRQRNVIGMTCELHKDVVGFMVYELHPKMLNVVRFAVHPNFQRTGIGTCMVERLWNKLSTQRRRFLECVVSERSTDAHLFLKSLDFAAVSVERGHFKSGHDGYKFRYTLKVENEIPKWVSRISTY